MQAGCRLGCRTVAGRLQAVLQAGSQEGLRACCSLGWFHEAAPWPSAAPYAPSPPPPYPPPPWQVGGEGGKVTDSGW